MTPQERQLIEDLARRLAEHPVTQKEPEADALIQRLIASRPDALYQLVQVALVQNLALEQAQAEVQELHRRLADENVAPAQGGSFLGGLLGSWAQPSSAPGRRFGRGAPATPPPLPRQQAAPPPPAPVVMMPAGGGYGSYGGWGGGFGGSGGMSSFLQTAAATATGIAAGSLAAGAIESIFHHSGGGRSFTDQFADTSNDNLPQDNYDPNQIAEGIAPSFDEDRSGFLDNTDVSDTPDVDDGSGFDSGGDSDWG